MTTKVCDVCGASYEAVRKSQRYCSQKCRRYGNRHDEFVRSDIWLSGEKEIRRFNCVKCGKVVRVTSPDDRRTKFCSRRCEKRYWRHSKSVQPIIVRREFKCRMCGKYVLIEEAKDLRRVFCSQECANNWHKKGLVEKEKPQHFEIR